MSTPTATIEPLTDEQVQFFRDNGYLKIDKVTSDEDVATLRESYDRIFREKAGWEEGGQFDLGGTEQDGEPTLPQILSPAKYAPEMLDSELYANVSAIGKRLLGDNCVTAFAHAIYKPPHSGAETPWHQDASYWDPSTISKTISVWVPLQEATLENGCMHFVPGSHKLDVIKHQSINNDPRIHGLEVHPDDMHHVEGNVVACPLPPGGATMHGGYTLHYAPPNRSDIPRRAIILMCSVPGEKRDQPLRFPWLEEKKTAGMKRREAAQKQQEQQGGSADADTDQ
ncbi:MAG: phytanoyl-CoA dioxygenase family protein [Phycisphaeraceae bacterium]